MKKYPTVLLSAAILVAGVGVLISQQQSPGAPADPPPADGAPPTTLPAQPVPQPAVAVPSPAVTAPAVTTPANAAPANANPASSLPAFPPPPVLRTNRTAPRPGAPGITVSTSTVSPGNIRTIPPRTTPTAAPPSFPMPSPVRNQAVPAATPATPAPGLSPAPAAANLPTQPVPPASFGGGFAPASTNLPALGADGTIAPGVLALQMANIEQVLSLYAELTQRTVLRNTLQLPKVDVMLSNQTAWTREEAIQALDTVLAMNGISMVNVGDKFVSAVPSNSVLQEAGAFSRGDPSELAETGQFVTKVVKVKHALPSELQQVIASFSKTQNGIVAIDSTMTLVLRDYPANVKRMTELLADIDVEVEKEYKLEVIPIKYGKVDEIYGTMSALIGGSGAGVAGGAGAVARTTGVGRTSSRSIRSGTRGGSGGGGYGGYGGSSGYGGYNSGYGGYRSGGGYYPQQASVTPIPGTTATRATTPATTFNQRFQNVLNRAAGQQGQPPQMLEDARIVPDERSNSLIVYANKEDMKVITNMVAKVDRLLAQVVIDAIIMDVSLTDAYQLGVSWLMNPQKTGDWTSVGASRNGQNLVSSLTNIASGGGGFTYLARFKDDLTVAVGALAANNRGQVLSRPRIQTSHAMEASFSVGQTVPYVTTTSFGGTYYGPSSQFQQLSVSTELNVIPYITPDGLVVMEIDQNIEEIAGFEEFPNVGRLPKTVYRSASAVVSVRDRETIILGGYIRASKSKTSSGVPLLKDIPLLGTAFRNKGSDSQRSELIVLIRPTVLTTPEDAAAEAEAERNRLPGISEMEKDIHQYQESTKDRLNTLFGK